MNKNWSIVKAHSDIQKSQATFSPILSPEGMNTLKEHLQLEGIVAIKLNFLVPKDA